MSKLNSFLASNPPDSAAESSSSANAVPTPQKRNSLSDFLAANPSNQVPSAEDASNTSAPRRKSLLTNFIELNPNPPPSPSGRSTASTFVSDDGSNDGEGEDWADPELVAKKVLTLSEGDVDKAVEVLTDAIAQVSSVGEDSQEQPQDDVENSTESPAQVAPSEPPKQEETQVAPPEPPKQEETQVTPPEPPKQEEAPPASAPAPQAHTGLTQTARGDRASSGQMLQLTEDFGAKFKALKLRRKHRFLVLHINGDFIEFETIGDPKMGIDDICKALPYSECRFAIYDHEYRSVDGRPQNKIYFMTWLPHNATPYSQMQYSHGKNVIRSQCPGVFDLPLKATEELRKELGGEGGRGDDEDDDSESDFSD